MKNPFSTDKRLDILFNMFQTKDFNDMDMHEFFRKMIVSLGRELGYEWQGGDKWKKIDPTK